MPVSRGPVGKPSQFKKKNTNDEEKKMKELADLKDQEELEKEQAHMKKMNSRSVILRLTPYNKPVINIIVAFISTISLGIIFPSFGIFVA